MQEMGREEEGSVSATETMQCNRYAVKIFEKKFFDSRECCTLNLVCVGCRRRLKLGYLTHHCSSDHSSFSLSAIY